MADAQADLRARVDTQLEKVVDDEVIRELLSATLATTKQARGWCPNCKKAVMVEIADGKAAIQALEILLNQAKGRPAQAEDVADDRIVFERVVYMTDEPEGVPV